MAASFVVNISINAGASFTQSFTVDSSGGLLNLSQYQINSQLRKHAQSTSYVNFITTSVYPSTGVFELELTPEVSSTLKPGRYVYDVILTNNASGEKTRVVEGTAIVTSNVTK